MPRTDAWHWYSTYSLETSTTWLTDTQTQFQTILGLWTPDPVNFISVHTYGTDMANLGSAATAAVAIGKPLFVGEFQVYPSDTPTAVQPFKDFVASLDQYNVPLAAVWVFDFDYQTDWSISGTNARSWVLGVLNTWNTRNTAPVSNFYGWQLAKFTATQRLDPLTSGLNATPAHDGISNLLKYALHLEPLVKGFAGLPKQGVVTVGGKTYLTLTYTQTIGVTDISYLVELSGDLTTWVSGTGTTSSTVTNNADGVTQTVVAQDLVPITNSSKRFIRLRVTGP